MKIALTLKQFIKRILSLVEKVIPAPVYRKLYYRLHNLYKSMTRMIYGLKIFGYSLSGNRDGKEMARLVYKVMPYSLVGIGGLEATYKLAKMMNGKAVPGYFVELGVARGGCAALLGSAAFENNDLGRELWLFDSFEGLPDPTEEDFSGGKTGEHVSPLQKGACLGTIEDVSHLLLNIFKFPADRVVFKKGWFQDTLPNIKDELKEIAILRIDGDWYESTKTCLEYLYHKVTPGGAVIIDDYDSCFGCKKAVDEFLLNNNIAVKMGFDRRGGCYFLKPA